MNLIRYSLATTMILPLTSALLLAGALSTEGGLASLEQAQFSARTLLGSKVHFDTGVGDGVHPEGQGSIWARGRGYKARADSSGFTFIPFLGSDAPQNYPLRLRLRELARGADAITLEEATSPSWDDHRIVLDRGAVAVRYDLSPAGVEQSFEIEAAPGTGDLVLHLETATELLASSQNGGFTFSNERGGVRIGAAVVFDSQGQRADVDAAWVGDEIQLTVPSSFLEEAEWPIVVDPLMTPFTVGNSTADLTHPDTAYTPHGARYCVVCEEHFSAADTDIALWYVSPDGTVAGGGYVEQSSASWSKPRASMQTAAAEALLVVAEGDSVLVPGSTDIVGRGRYQNDPFSAPFVIESATSNYSCSAPDIGTDGLVQDGTSYLVAFRRVDASGRGEIHAALATVGNAWPSRPIANRPTYDTSAPAVSSSSGTCCLSLEYMVAWSTREIATGASSVRLARVDYANNQNFSTITIASPSLTSLYFDVDVSATSTRSTDWTEAPPFLVTFDDRLSATGDAFVAVCATGSPPNLYQLQLSEHADLTPNQNDLVVATGFGRFALGYEENDQLYVTIVEPTGNELAIVERRQFAIGSDLVPGTLATAGALYSAPDNWDSLFLWSQSRSGSLDIAGTIAQGPPGIAAGVQFCHGTVNSTGDRGFIQVSGTSTVTATHTLQVEALPPSVFGFFLASKDAGFVVNAGGSQGLLCLGGAIGRFGIFQADSGGRATQTFTGSQIAQPAGPVSAVVGERWRFQSWYRDAVGGSATSNFTNGAIVEFR